MVYSHYKNCPAILTKDCPPHPFELLGKQEKQLEFFAGERKLDLYNFLVFNLSMNGLLPFGGQVANFERLESGGIKVVTENTLVCHLDSDNIAEIYPEVSDKKKVVLDWINVRSGLKHDFDTLSSGTDIVSNIYFYPSDRIDGSEASNLKDMAAVSYMTDEEILDSNYSQFYVRMRAAEIMKEAGIRGPKNGIGPSGQRHRPLLLENYKREVYPLVKSKIEIPQAVSTLPVVYL